MQDCKLISTPMASKGNISCTHGTALPEPTVYRQLVGALQYLTMTRLDISYVVQHVFQFFGSTTDVHHEVMKRILRYLKSTLDIGLPIRRSTDSSFLVAYSDADWAGCPDTRRSTTGYCVFLGPNLISWSAKKQRTISHSSVKAEYHALPYACANTIWIQGLFHEVRHPIPHLVILNCDNLSATYLVANPVFHAQTKHIAIDYHFVGECKSTGSFHTLYSSTCICFHQRIVYKRFAQLISKLVSSPMSSLHGSIRELQ